MKLPMTRRHRLTKLEYNPRRATPALHGGLESVGGRLRLLTTKYKRGYSKLLGKYWSMIANGQPTRRMQLAAPYLEVWEQDRRNPKLYHYEGETLMHDALRRRGDESQGLTVIRLDRADPPNRGSVDKS